MIHVVYAQVFCVRSTWTIVPMSRVNTTERASTTKMDSFVDVCPDSTENSARTLPRHPTTPSMRSTSLLWTSQAARWTAINLL